MTTAKAFILLTLRSETATVVAEKLWPEMVGVVMPQEVRDVAF